MTLLKKIFEGYPEGFYESGRFDFFMRSSQFSSINDVPQRITEREKDNAHLYTITPYGVTVRYERHDDEVQVLLSGDKEKVEYLEGIFLQEAGARGF
ncbi:MAG TPA: hypothetical protein VJH22_00790 [Candidatus Nanoarchaeia archaeon]|nr:hypothetical protein [Candidatus Nanoarchaeia archaeon]